MRRPRPERREGGSGARDAFSRAFDLLGGAEALAAWALDKPTDFYRLFARLIPFAGEDAGEGEREVEIVRFSDPSANDDDGEDPTT
jgi:hypothetical protein